MSRHKALLIALISAAPLRAAGPPAEIRMNEFVVARLGEHPSVRTAGLSTCVAVFLYDSSTKIGAVGHISATVEPRIFTQSIINEMIVQGADPRRLQAQLIGGWDTREVRDLVGFNSTSPTIVAGIKAALSARRIPVVREETLTIPFQKNADNRPAIRNVSMDLATGIVNDY